MNIDEALNTINLGDDNQQIRIAYEFLIKEKIHNPDIIQVFASGLVNNDRGIRDICSRGLIETSPELHADCANYVVPFIAHIDIEIRNLAGEILINLAESSINSLLPFLSNASEDVRKFACDILGLIGNYSILNDIYPLLKDNDENVVMSAIESIGNIAQKTHFNDYDLNETVKALKELYFNNENTKAFIIDAFSKLVCDDSENFLLEILSNENDVFLKTAAIDSLSVCSNNISVCHDLFDQLPNTETELQSIVLKTIYAIAFRLDTILELPDNLRFVAQNALLDDDAEIRAAGLFALNNFVPEDIDFLLNELKYNNQDTTSHIIYTISNSYNNNLIQEFYHSFLRTNLLNDLDGNTFDFISILSKFWDYLPTKNKEIIFNELMEFTIKEAQGYEITISELFLKLDKNLMFLILYKLTISKDSVLKDGAQKLIEYFEKLNN